MTNDAVRYSGTLKGEEKDEPSTLLHTRHLDVGTSLRILVARSPVKTSPLSHGRLHLRREAFLVCEKGAVVAEEGRLDQRSGLVGRCWSEETSGMHLAKGVAWPGKCAPGTGW